ncbi:YceI family protein [Actinomadura macrotermitis]|uniref:Protein YceI n=1 Tax=Actinomadura macrotermitis TaxID=2585200 RepID=A0A7K0C806_9ACTN|nr:YceI family protein [Actinomadura macrotermitis]MQY09476.1 Protein YceI [Actinomadura macrotermitis]
MTDLSELTGDYVLDPAHTRIGFVARHTMATRVRGHFDEFEGEAHLNGDHPSKSAARLTIQAKSIQTGNPQRDDLLRERFLNAADHPAITFIAAEVEQTGETAFKVTGDLGIRGMVRPVTVDVELTGENGGRAGFRGGVTLDRNDWGVNWNAATKAFISPKVTVEFDIAATRRP